MPPSELSPAVTTTPPIVARRRARRGAWFRLPPPARWRGWLLVALAYALATIGMTWPMAADLTTQTSFRRDALLQVWVGRWVQHALVTNPLHLYDANIFYPLAHTLAYTDADVPGALLMAPAVLLTGDGVLAYNLAVLATFVVAATGVYALVRRLTGNSAAAFLAGLAYAFLPYRYSHLQHLNLLGDAWTPWVLLALVALLERPTWPAALACGLLLAVEAASSFYLAFQIALVVGLVLLVALVARPAARRPRCLVRLAAALALALALVVPLGLPYLQVRDQQGLERGLAETEAREASPAAYLRTVDRTNWAWRWLTVERNGEDTLFVGGVALVGAVTGLALGLRRRRGLTLTILLVGAAAFVLSLGPTWRPGTAGARPLPYRVLFDHVALFRAMRAPGRFGVVVDLAVVVLAGCGAAWGWERLAPRLGSRRRLLGRALTALLAALILAELVSAPVALTPFDRGAAAAAPYRWLAAQSDRGPVIEFPAAATPRDTVVAMYWSTLSWYPLVQGASGFDPAPHEALLHAFDGDLRRPDGTVAHAVSYVDAANVGYLQDLGVRYAVLHRDSYRPEDWPQVLAAAAATGQLDPVYRDAATVIYRVRAAPPAAPVALRLTAPPVAGAPGTPAWTPSLVLENPLPRWAVLYVKAPVWLTLTWRDAAWRVVRRDRLTVPLPVVGPPGELRCEVGGCRLAGLPAPTPPPRLYPATPGRYTVELAVDGGLTARATATVEVAGGR